MKLLRVSDCVAIWHSVHGGEELAGRNFSAVKLPTQGFLESLITQQEKPVGVGVGGVEGR